MGWTIKIILGIIGFGIAIADITYYWSNMTSMPPDISSPWLWIWALVAGFILFIGASLPVRSR